jgi:hypothetical protein
MVMRDGARFPLALRLRSPAGVPLGEVFTFMSELYFRGKLLYARKFARPPAGVPGIHVITPMAGLVPADAPVTVDDLRRFGEVDIDEDDPRYRHPLSRSVEALAAAVPSDCDVVMLGSIATAKYVDVLSGILGPRLLFPPSFVGRGDMSRGGLLLRSARSSQELDYVPLAGAVLHGKRPEKLPRVRRSRR